MKRSVIAIALLGLSFYSTTLEANSNTQIPPPTDQTQKEKLENLIKATAAYKASLERLRAVYEKNLRAEEDRLAEVNKLYSENLILKSDLDRSAAVVRKARQKVIEVIEQIVIVDRKLAKLGGGTSSNASSLVPDDYGVIPSGEKVASIIRLAEDNFRKGKLNLGAGKRSEARDDFDQAVDVILTSGINVQVSNELQEYYLDLVERIYREEVPTINPAQPSNVVELVAQGGRRTPANPVPSVGFVDQRFSPSALDELSELVLTEDEQSVGNSKSNLPMSYFGPTKYCNSPLIKKAQLRGFHLDMTAAEIRSRLPGFRLPAADSSGYARAIIRFSKTEPAPQFLHGVITVVFDFVDGRVSYIGVVYDNSIKWNSLEQFTRQVSRTLGLPEQWQSYSSNGTPQKMLRCEKLRFVSAMLRAGKSSAPALFLVDDTGIDKLVARRQAQLESVRKVEQQRRQQKAREEEERRKLFKP